MNNSRLKFQITHLPTQPGVYKYYDGEGRLLYVGKARNLKKRVASYFMERQQDFTGRIRLMVAQIRQIEYTVVLTEYDALLLENTLIKKLRPKYNISLRDDKSYPFITIKNERFPRVYATRNPVKDGSEYYGPYSHVRTMKNMLELIKKLFPLRTCNFNLSEENISAGKFKVCLDYHIKLCKGPCEAFQKQKEYDENIQHIRYFLKGNIRELVQSQTLKMNEAVERLAFEEAGEHKKRVELLEIFQARSMVVSHTIGNVEVLNFYTGGETVYVNYMQVKNGSIIRSDTIRMRKKLEESDAEVLLMALAEMRSKYGMLSKEIVVPFRPLIQTEEIKFHIPKLGDKKKLLDLSRQNAMAYYDELVKREETSPGKRKNLDKLLQVQKDLSLVAIPFHIECFDNSNIQGTEAVSAIVVFKNALPSRKDYRIFNVKTVEGIDDFATMREAVYRRYKRMLEEHAPLPQLIIIDGGKGQLSAAVESLKKLDIENKVEIIGIAKRLEEIYKPGDSFPLSINKKSYSLKIIQQARDEAHRTGITRHREKRNKTALTSSLLDIPGVGPETTKKLLSYFKSVKKINEASLEEIAVVVGKAKAETIIKELGKGKGE